jgi:hypothetical protein
MNVISRKTSRLIKRHEAGDRSPGLLRALNEAAWQGFHDPWEPAPQLKENSTQEPGGAMDPETVQPFTLETIESHLKRKEINYWKSDQKICLVFMGYDQDSDRCVRAMHFVEGKHDTVYRLRVVADRRVDAKDFTRARELCDKWNGTYRWPRAFLEIPTMAEDASTPGSGLLVMDYQCQLAKGIHPALFDDLVGEAVATSYDFWKMAREEFNL